MTVSSLFNGQPACIVTVTGFNCPLPQGCLCGADQRCSAYYTQFADAATTTSPASSIPSVCIVVLSLTSFTCPPWTGILDRPRWRELCQPIQLSTMFADESTNRIFRGLKPQIRSQPGSYLNTRRRGPVGILFKGVYYFRHFVVNVS